MSLIRSEEAARVFEDLGMPATALRVREGRDLSQSVITAAVAHKTTKRSNRWYYNRILGAFRRCGYDPNTLLRAQDRAWITPSYSTLQGVR